MYRMQLGFALAAAIGAGGWWTPGQELASLQVAQDAAAPAELPPPAALVGDPADSLYRAAREALTRREFRRAADLFARIGSQYPKSGYAPDALYWQAFALYRVGGTAQLREARDALRRQRERFPDAATKGDAAALDVRIQGELARQGDSQAAESVTEMAGQFAEPPTPPTPPVPGEAPEPPEPPDHDGDDRCQDDDNDTKIAAMNALIHMDSERAQPILKKVLARKDAASVCLRRKAVFLISQGGGEGAEEILLASARNDPDPEVREQAVFWLSQVGSERAVGALDSILRTSKDRNLQEKAIFALSQQESPAPGRHSGPMPSGPTHRSTCGSRRSSGSARAVHPRAEPTCGSCSAGSKVRSSRRRSSSRCRRWVARRTRSGSSAWPAIGLGRSRPGSRRSSGPDRAGRRSRTSPLSTTPWTTGR